MLLLYVACITVIGYNVLAICLNVIGQNCCFGHSWDEKNQTCIQCKPGFYGEKCEEKCRFPNFGLECQGECLCTAEFCNATVGCIIPNSPPTMTNVFKAFEQSTYATQITTEDDNPVQNSLKSNSWLIGFSSSLSSILILFSFALLYYGIRQKLKKSVERGRSKRNTHIHMVKQNSSESYMCVQKGNVASKPQYNEHLNETTKDDQERETIYQDIQEFSDKIEVYNDKNLQKEIISSESSFASDTYLSPQCAVQHVYVEVIENGEDETGDTKLEKVKCNEERHGKNRFLCQSEIVASESEITDNTYLFAI
ncbi:uncharacterized protein LOC134232420 [Saccostrea cucullata]|uniref:uncharacterized protein LOC134232420 n=1 Tax=Saccostrea cuccullata TaxID=36930 RepID=UPI002ED4E54F